MESMKEAIARLFAHIILFFQQTVKWYNMTPAGRAVSSIFKPLELDYEESLKEIKLCSQAVNNIANGASRAELRNIHTIIEMQNQQLKERDERLHEMQKQLNHIQEKIDISTTSILQVATS
jgi:septal ring factor EnvC (AmiA/AmiB activator)